jgi:hypothetical protein
MSAPTKIRMNWAGDKEMTAKLKAVAADKGLRKEARSALLGFGGEVKDRIEAATPEKTGKLKRSLKLRALVSMKKENMRITITAGGPDVPYAVRQHETHRTMSKFMERPLRAAQAGAAREIADRIDLSRAAKETA